MLVGEGGGDAEKKEVERRRRRVEIRTDISILLGLQQCNDNTAKRVY